MVEYFRILQLQYKMYYKSAKNAGHIPASGALPFPDFFFLSIILL